jgi:hypothetical protein
MEQRKEKTRAVRAKSTSSVMLSALYRKEGGKEKANPGGEENEEYGS